jgi:hypothetical protein
MNLENAVDWEMAKYNPVLLYNFSYVQKARGIIYFVICAYDIICVFLNNNYNISTFIDGVFFFTSIENPEMWNRYRKLRAGLVGKVLELLEFSINGL